MSSPEDLLNACATSQEERQRLISRANDALPLWDNWLHPFTSGSETGDGLLTTRKHTGFTVWKASTCAESARAGMSLQHIVSNVRS